MNFRANRKDRPELNLIPMIDVLIVLLIFLVLTTTFSHEAALKLNLPQAEEGQPPVTEDHIEISIDAFGHYFINQQQLINTRMETLKSALKQAAGDNADPLIILSADQKTPHQSVITALDAASQMGFSHFTFAIQSDNVILEKKGAQ